MKSRNFCCLSSLNMELGRQEMDDRTSQKEEQVRGSEIILNGGHIIALFF